MRRTIGITEKSSGRSANWRALIILAAVAGGVAALLAGTVNWRAARAAAAQQSGTWTQCANEGATCAFTGTKRVRYGAGGTYNFATFTGGVQCSNDVFGDPVYGVVKSCDYQEQLPTATPTPAGTPDYSNVNDILNGRRLLLRTDDLAVFNMGTGQTSILQTTDSTITDATNSFPTAVNSIQSFATLTGLMFNLSAEVVVNFVGNGSEIAFSVYNPLTKTSALALPSTGVPGVGVVHAMKMADFNGDGFDDLVVNYGNSAGTNAMQILNAADVNNFAAGMISRGENLQTDAISADAMVVGDFNGDGRPEIIGVIPQADGNGLRLALHTVDEKTLQISDGVHFPLTIPEGSAEVKSISAATGQFTSLTHDQLLIAYATNDANAKVKLIDFTPSPFQPQEQSIWDSGDEIKTGRFGVYDWTGLLRLKVGRFDWSSQFDQPLLLHGNNFYREAGTNSFSFTLSNLAIDPVDFSIKALGNVKLDDIGTKDDYGTVSDMVLGNFDRRDPDPQNSQQKDRNPNLQAAVLSTDYTGSETFVTIYDIDLTTFAPKQATAYEFATVPTTSIRFASGDLQGRSIRLGEPQKVTIEGTTQPTVVAAAPPMHVDFMTAVGASKQSVLNLTTVPEGFHTTYETDETSSNQSSTTNTTSWSFGAKESIGASFGIGDVDAGDGVEIKDTFTAAQALKGSTEKTHGTYSSNGFDVSTRTGFADQVWYSQTRFNIYIYPVIGQTVCPKVCPKDKPDCPESEKVSNPDCADSEKVPLTVQFSGPDQISYEAVAGSQIEWYQPPWEYGNILSYPGSYAQLQQLVPDINKLSQDRTFATDASVENVKTKWATGTSDSQSSSFKQNYSFDNDTSVTGKINLGIFNAGASVDIDISGSFGFSSLNKSSTDLGKSTGIAINKPGSFRDPGNYAYSFTPYIFGQKQPGGSVDNIPLSGDVQTFGLLRTAFVVDPTTDNDAGGWWKQAYTNAPDVALNHPSRWVITTPGLSNPIPANCLATGTGSSQMDCAALAPSYPANPSSSEFHHMRGFFISNASHPGQGPQLETAKAGDKLALQTRVYNYSLKAMDPDAKVHVRFYAMPWNNSTNCPAGPPTRTFPYCPLPANATPSFLIGEEVLSAIPPFNTDPSAPLNWVLAQTTFDTTPYADKYLAFWVVVWTEDANGTLAAEVADHGLTAIPGTLTSLADVKTESHSNNVGFYKMPFYVFAPSNGAPQTVEQNGPDDVRLGRVRVSDHRIESGQAVEVSALLRTRARSASGVSAVFYDGDPAAGGKAFDVERIPHLRARDTYQVRVLFRPQECGVRRVFVSIGKGKPFEATDSSFPVRVRCADGPPFVFDRMTLQGRTAGNPGN